MRNVPVGLRHPVQELGRVAAVAEVAQTVGSAAAAAAGRACRGGRRGPVQQVVVGSGVFDGDG